MLRHRWISALEEGMVAAGLELPIDESDIVFPYFGDALRDATTEDPLDVAMVRYPRREHEDHFHCAVLRECLEHVGITDEMVASEPELSDTSPPSERDDLASRLSASLSNEWVQRGLRVLDHFVPGASARSLEATAADVTRYLADEQVQAHIENGVTEAFATCGSEETVVVGHSLGSIVAYRMLRDGGRVTCPVKTLITLGSPLGISVVRQALEPIGHPPGVGTWFNAYDDRDVVALNALDDRFFPVDPSIENFDGIRNESENHHHVQGYLSDPVVARRIAEALTT